MLPIQPQPAGLPSGSFGRRTAARSGGWQLRRVLAAPHRLAFMAGSALMLVAALWWALALVARFAGLDLPWRVSPSSAHALVMAQGFLPLFIVGFAFTAGPRWLGLGEVSARLLALPVGLMVAGWAVALPGFHGLVAAASLGVAVAAVGLALAAGLFGLLVLESQAGDRRHAAWVCVGFALAAVAQWAAAVALALQLDAAVRAAAVAGLWGGLGLVFVSVLHRMLPFFTQGVLPQVPAWRPQALLGVLVLAMLAQAALVGAETFAGGVLSPAAAALRAAFELPVGALLVWVSLRWGLRASLSVRLLAMLHVGFAWLGIAFVLGGLSHALAAASGGRLGLGLAPMHAFTMGFLASTLLAMATRVARGHSGRPLVADPWTWQVFWVLQLAVVLRLLAALWPAAATGFTLLAAQFWLAAMGAWALRHMRWFGRARVDGAAG